MNKKLLIKKGQAVKIFWIILIVFLIILNILVSGLAGIFVSLGLTVLISLYNLYIASTAWKKRGEIGKRSAFFAFGAGVIWLSFFSVPLLLNISSPTILFILFISYIFAITYNLKIFSHSEEKGKKISKLIIFYNLLGAAIIFLNFLAKAGIDFTGLASIINHTFTLSHTLFQMTNFFFLQIFNPVLFIPPVLLGMKKPEKIIEKALTNIVKIYVVYAVVFILIASIASIFMLSSFSKLPVFREDYQLTEMVFGSKILSFSNEAKGAGEWRKLLTNDIEVAKDLGLDYVDLYVDLSYIENPSKKQNLVEGVRIIKNSGLKTILACAGSEEWYMDKPSLEEHDRAMKNCAIELAKLNPDYVILFVEPNERHNALMLPEPYSPQAYRKLTEEIIAEIRKINNRTKTAITIATGNEESFEFFKELQNTNIDAIGLDIHPFTAGMIDVFYKYIKTANFEKEIWVFEFGIETQNFGEEIQARYMSLMPKLASDAGVTGVVQWEMLDNPQSQMGLVYQSGKKKLGFHAYKNAIERTQGNSYDYSRALKEKQVNNTFFLIIFLLILAFLAFIAIKRLKKQKTIKS